jgi:hypothetical protein
LDLKVKAALYTNLSIFRLQNFQKKPAMDIAHRAADQWGVHDLRRENPLSGNKIY